MSPAPSQKQQLRVRLASKLDRLRFQHCHLGTVVVEQTNTDVTALLSATTTAATSAAAGSKFPAITTFKCLRSCHC